MVIAVAAVGYSVAVVPFAAVDAAAGEEGVGVLAHFCRYLGGLGIGGAGLGVCFFVLRFAFEEAKVRVKSWWLGVCESYTNDGR